MHESNYQQIYHTTVDFCNNQEQTLTFDHFIEQLYYTFFESCINQEHILFTKGNSLIASLHIFLVLR